MSKKPNTRIIIALDFADRQSALDLVDQLGPDQCKLKVGKELFTRTGPQLINHLVDRGYDVFLDLKFHDIPNTVAAAVLACADLGVWMVNVHCLGGSKMLQAARRALDGHGGQTLLTGVTVLTSLNHHDLLEIGLDREPGAQALLLARLAKQAGLDGIICSGREASAIKDQFGDDFLRVTPGIRPNDYTTKDDQARTLTPKQALSQGSSYLVIGRPVTGASSPVDALLAIKREIGEDGSRE